MHIPRIAFGVVDIQCGPLYNSLSSDERRKILLSAETQARSLIPTQAFLWGSDKMRTHFKITEIIATEGSQTPQMKHTLTYTAEFKEIPQVGYKTQEDKKKSKKLNSKERLDLMVTMLRQIEQNVGLVLRKQDLGVFPSIKVKHLQNKTDYRYQKANRPDRITWHSVA